MSVDEVFGNDLLGQYFRRLMLDVAHEKLRGEAAQGCTIHEIMLAHGVLTS